MEQAKQTFLAFFRREKLLKWVVALGLCGMALIYLSSFWIPEGEEPAPPADAGSSAEYSQSLEQELSRIISAESRGEPLEGQIAVGNVVLNRVASADFPDTIYGVIFDDRWGGQFTPVRNGTIYQEPSARSVEAARLCLSGANTAGESLYFLAPALATNHWVMENRTHVVTIGSHWFYK